MITQFEIKEILAEQKLRFTYARYQERFLKDAKKLKDGETVKFVAIADYKFKDKDKDHLLLIVNTGNSEWKEYIRTNAMDTSNHDFGSGECTRLADNKGKIVLRLELEKGRLTDARFEKQLKKFPPSDEVIFQTADVTVDDNDKVDEINVKAGGSTKPWGKTLFEKLKISVTELNSIATQREDLRRDKVTQINDLCTQWLLSHDKVKMSDKEDERKNEVLRIQQAMNQIAQTLPPPRPPVSFDTLSAARTRVLQDTVSTADVKLTNVETLMSQCRIWKALHPVGSDGKLNTEQELMETVLDQLEQAHENMINSIYASKAKNWDNSDLPDTFPSSSGAKGGVVFTKINGESWVIKPVKGTPAGVLFGEHVLKHFGAETTDSRPVKANSPEGVKLMNLMTNAKNANELDFQNNRTDTNAKRKENWDNKYPTFASADYFLVQNSLNPKKELATIIKNDPLEFLEDLVLIKNIGKAMVADALIGNGDRFDNINFENAFINTASELVAIDTEAIMQEFNPQIMVLETMTGWVDFLIKGGTKIENGSDQGGAPSSKSINFIPKNFDHWFKNAFKHDLLLLLGDQPPVIDDEVWDKAKETILEGIEDGFNHLNESFSKSGFSNMKSMLKLYGEMHDTDENYSVSAFKIRAAYLEALTKGEEGKVARKLAMLEGSYLLWKRHWDGQIASVKTHIVNYDRMSKSTVTALLSDLKKLSEDLERNTLMLDYLSWFSKEDQDDSLNEDYWIKIRKHATKTTYRVCERVEESILNIVKDKDLSKAVENVEKACQKLLDKL